MSDKRENQLSRRTFIKGAAASAGSLALLGVGIESAVALPAPKKWDEKADVVVAGGGGAGLSAAIWARKSGAKVICVEKASTSMASSTAVSAGGFAAAGTRSQKKENVQDSSDLLYKDIMSFTNNEADPAVAKMYSTQSLKAYEWLMDLGVPLVLLQHVESHSVAREHWLNAAQLMQLMEKEAGKQGVGLYLNTAATNLLVNDKGRVIGLRAKSKKGEMNIMAKKSVILASGGFAANLPLCGEFGGPEFRAVETLGGKGNVGDGLLVALRLGAATKNMYGSVVNENLAIASAANVTLPQVVWDGGILVNKDGKRFMRESRACFEMGGETILQPDRTAFIIWDSSMKKSPLTSRKLAREATLSGGPVQSGSLRELAAKLNIKPDQFEETVNKYNSNIDKNADPDFGRTTLSGTEGKPVKIAVPPFYGIQIFAKSYWTKGGLKTDDRCRALNWDNKTIPGLYAAGEIMFGNIGSKVLTMGTGVGGAVTFGMVAGENAAKEKPWTK
ncbi:MAG: Fumarate reductase flavoprotein subunit precursor [Smithella sp. PtaU1.Bin162]|nr:MAG: Fumarate reductase flavoprotein subunit precursor [Smithella sp. PtaU1.Bin162]